MEPIPISPDGSCTERRGRKPRAEAAGRPFRVRLSPAERERLSRAAAADRKSLAEFARDALVTAAEDILEELGGIS